MANKRKPNPSTNKNISINGDVKDSAVIIGDNNTVNQTIVQKFFNIFKSDAETLEHRNRRILLGHVENAWIKRLNLDYRITMIGSLANQGNQANQVNQG